MEKSCRAHGGGVGVPPIHAKPPYRGALQLERTHSFAFKMSAAVLLGPRCNHDLGVVAKLPVLLPVMSCGTQGGTKVVGQGECSTESADRCESRDARLSFSCNSAVDGGVARGACDDDADTHAALRRVPDQLYASVGLQGDFLCGSEHFSCYRRPRSG